MQKLFNKILIPIDFSANSKILLQKAVGLAQQYDCSIHLLHVIATPPLSIIAIAESYTIDPYNNIDNIHELEFEFETLLKKIIQQKDNPIKIQYSIVTGSWDSAVITFIEQNKIDLVLIGQKVHFFKKRKMFLNPDIIAEKTKVAVISMPINKRLVRLYSIVIPVTDFVPVKKLIYGIYMAFNFNCTIKLLGIKTLKTSETVDLYLTKSKQIVQQNCPINVEIETKYSQNIAIAVNQFALSNSVDLIIVNPRTQTKMPGFFAAFWGNILQKYASLPVLTISAF